MQYGGSKYRSKNFQVSPSVFISSNRPYKGYDTALFCVKVFMIQFMSRLNTSLINIVIQFASRDCKKVILSNPLCKKKVMLDLQRYPKSFFITLRADYF